MESGSKVFALCYVRSEVSGFFGLRFSSSITVLNYFLLFLFRRAKYFYKSQVSSSISDCFCLPESLSFQNDFHITLVYLFTILIYSWFAYALNSSSRLRFLTRSADRDLDYSLFAWDRIEVILAYYRSSSRRCPAPLNGFFAICYNLNSPFISLKFLCSPNFHISIPWIVSTYS